MAFYGKYALLAIGAAVAVSSTAGAQSTDWANRISVNGDARFRLQKDFNSCFAVTGGQCQSSDNLYGRMRFRLGVNAKVNDALSAVARLSTGANQYSTNFNFGQSGSTQGAGFSQRQTLTFDQAYFNYKIGDSMSLQIGKMPVPFWVAGNIYEIWLFDQGFEGVTFKWAGDMGALKPYASIGYYDVVDRTAVSNAPATSTVGGDVNLLGAQLGVKYATDMWWGNLALGSYNFNTKDVPISTITGAVPVAASTNVNGTRGNSINTTASGPCAAGTCYAYDYKELDVQAEVGYNLGFAPIALYGNYTANSDGNNKTAMLGGLKLGTLKDVGSWSVSYNYRDIGSDAFLAAYSDTDFVGTGGTGFYGHAANVAYQAWPSASVGLIYYNGYRSQTNGSTIMMDSYIADLTAAF